MAGLLVEPNTLRAAGSQAQAAAESAPRGATQIGPCARDAVSIGVADRLSEQAQVAYGYTVMAGHTARSFGLLLDANATSYTEQEAASAATLGNSTSLPVPVMPTSLDLGAPPPAGAPTAVPAGETPATPRDIARLIHGGPGTGSMQTAAEQLRSHAEDLEIAADRLVSATSTIHSGWVSGSADTAVGRMTTLQQWYRDHADHVRGLAADVEAQADRFQSARAQIPTPQQIDQAERELRAATEANARSNGRLSSAVSQAQANLGRIHQAAVTGYSNYATAAAPIPHIPTPPPAPPAGRTQQAEPQQTDGNGAPADPKQHTAVTDPVKPVEAGTGVAEITGGPTWPAGDVESADLPRPPVSDPDPALSPVLALSPVTEALPEVVPAVVGSIVGGAGGALGGLAGAAPRMLGGMSSALSGMPTALTGLSAPAGAPSGGGEQPQTPETSGGSPQTPHVPETPSGGPDLSSGGSGGEPGGTEPSGVAGPLVPAVGMAAAPEVAAPMVAPVSAAPMAAETAEAGAGFGGMMIPPFLPPGRGGQSVSEADRKLYPPRRLKVLTPPNSEPVLRRREGRQPPKSEEEKS